jgi:sulfite exporter TauE/SafE
MKETLGYILLGAGFGAVAFRIAEIDSAPEWKAWVVIILFAVGLTLLLEHYKEETKTEINIELDRRIEEKIEEMRE